MVQEIDLYFPYLVLIYGAFMSLITSLPVLKERANESLNQELVQWFYGHRALGIVCFAIGGLWSFQRLLLS